ncbi:MAG: winged helix-turn-helix transcriptional regulator [Clostridiales bacterium]|jgi:DNA-binding MarR family transcriptional regulator|nr:winged helix-turn-helix transcriptional regulator [Clostridiales bacterium]
MNFEELARPVLMEIICRPYKDRQRKSDEISRGEAKMIGYLFTVGDGVTAGELSEKLDISTARVAMILNNLEKKGLVHRDEDTQDRRRVVVFLTPSGKAKGADDFESILRYMTELLTRLGERDAVEYIRLTRRVNEISEQISRGG